MYFLLKTTGLVTESQHYDNNLLPDGKKTPTPFCLLSCPILLLIGL